MRTQEGVEISVTGYPAANGQAPKICLDMYLLDGKRTIAMCPDFSIEEAVRFAREIVKATYNAHGRTTT